VNGTAAPDLIRLEYCQWLNTKYWLLYDHLCVKLKLELGPYTKSLMAVSEDQGLGRSENTFGVHQQP
jgi:hypothetical protein